MNDRRHTVRRFSPTALGTWQQFGDKEIHIGPAVDKGEGGPLSAYYARFGAGEIAELPAPYTEVWIVLEGQLLIRSNGESHLAGEGDMLHVSIDSPGSLEAMADTLIACVSVPAH